MPQDAQTQCSKGANNTGKLLVNKTYHFTVLYPELAILLLRVRVRGAPLRPPLPHVSWARLAAASERGQRTAAWLRCTRAPLPPGLLAQPLTSAWFPQHVWPLFWGGV